jgi:hypothetical protein
LSWPPRQSKRDTSAYMRRRQDFAVLTRDPDQPLYVRWPPSTEQPNRPFPFAQGGGYNRVQPAAHKLDSAVYHPGEKFAVPAGASTPPPFGLT